MSNSSDSNASNSDEEEVLQNGGPQNENPEDDDDEIEIEEVGQDRPPEIESSSESESELEHQNQKRMLDLFEAQQNQGKLMLKIYNSRSKPKFEPLKEDNLTQEKLQVFLRNVQADCTRENRSIADSVQFLGEQLSGVTLECFNAIRDRIQNANDFEEVKNQLIVQRFGPQDRDARRRRMKQIVFKEGKQTAVEYWREKEDAINYWDRNADTESFLEEMLDGLKGWKRHEVLKLEIKRYKRDGSHGDELRRKAKECFLDLFDGDDVPKTPEVHYIDDQKFTGTCFVCGKSGHKAIDCRQKLPKKPGQNQWKQVPAKEQKSTPGHWNSLLKTHGRFDKPRHGERREDNFRKQVPWNQEKQPREPERYSLQDNRKPAPKRAHENSGSGCNNCGIEGHWFMDCPFVDTRKTFGKLILKKFKTSERESRAADQNRP
jgi:hypothetical protein